MHPAGQLGKNWANQNAKFLFRRCGHPQWQKATSRTGRCTGISKVANAGVPQFLVNKTDRASFKYQEFTSSSYAKAITANWYTPPSLSPKGKSAESSSFMLLFLFDCFVFQCLILSFQFQQERTHSPETQLLLLPPQPTLSASCSPQSNPD